VKEPATLSPPWAPVSSIWDLVRSACRPSRARSPLAKPLARCGNPQRKAPTPPPTTSSQNPDHRVP
jgi:hypothetical protein